MINWKKIENNIANVSPQINIEFSTSEYISLLELSETNYLPIDQLCKGIILTFLDKHLPFLDKKASKKGGATTKRTCNIIELEEIVNRISGIKWK